ncbi:DUF3859 domain-containing protein [Taibaiella soli]|uniref:DUF3859 domain-containing protein n=1 Tax=Taibaiella soli TaxID=1649169 RepID=A0A2W2AL67_9BACT|nr:DUF3859 domain-containing protein [Taibaiella soli]PZF74322.1 hypothetical protein DN068_04760 [Taibaiella soli]
MMRQFLAPVALLLFTASCNSSYDKKYVPKENHERQTIRFMELGYGIGTPNSDHSEFTIKEPVDTIPLELGKEFGVRYSLESNFDEEVTIQTVWTFPDSMINAEEGGEKHIYLPRNKTVQPNESRFTAYILEEKTELIPGKWFLSIYYEGKLLYRKVFFLKNK